MNWQAVLLALGIVIEFISMVYYIRSIRKGSTRPHPISWAGWTAIGAVGAWATRSGGAGLGFYVAAAFVAITLSIFILSLLPGYGHGMDEKSPTDLPVLVAGIVLLFLRIFHIGVLRLDHPPVQATLAVLGDLCFTWFTIRKTLEWPDSEPLWPWLGAVVAATIGLVVLGKYNYTTVAYPAYLLAANAAIAAGILWGRGQKGNKGRRK